MLEFKKIMERHDVTLFPKAIPRKIIDKFRWPELLNNFGTQEFNIKYYGASDGTSDLYANKTKTSSLINYFEEKSDQWAIKENFKKDTLNPLWSYAYELLSEKFDFNLKDSKLNFTARISSKKWDFPNHFDGVENFMFCLNGLREVDISYEGYSNHFSLKPGDVFYIPSLYYHHFWADNTEPSFVINLTIQSKLANNFFEVYPQRFQEIINNL
jgi:ribosomal protein L16 Arg81 hydroxylase